MASVARSLARAVPARQVSAPLRRNLATAARSSRPTISSQTKQHARRGFASEAAPKGGNTGLWVGLGLAAAGGAGYYVYSTSSSAADVKPTVFVPTKEDYQKVYNDVAELLEDNDYDDGSRAPVILRLGWHASGTYDKATNTGGSDGATMRFAPESDHGANAGLKVARDTLEQVKQKHPWISYSDLWILSAICAVQEMGGPKIPYRPGRSDKDMSACTPDGRLPDAAKEHDHLRAIFGRMGFNDQEIVALAGAHAVGRCHTDRSGFDGPWTFSPTFFTNDYYKLLMNEKWGERKWNGPKQFQDVGSKSLMMLPADMALVKDKVFRKHVERYAKDQDLFFTEFSAVVEKLFELGVPFKEGTEKMTFKATID
jgi:cytochrome c peroxidase